MVFENSVRLPELLEEWLGYVQEKDEKVAYYRWAPRVSTVCAAAYGKCVSGTHALP
jgi:hypothetical protein